jgi:tryptophan 2,3-dioxygenase
VTGLLAFVSPSAFRELALWQSNGNAAEFPYGAVMACYRACGKHFVPDELLEALASIRASLQPPKAGDRHRAVLDAFLAIALDKWDQKYDYLTYLGIDLLGLAPDADGATGLRLRDEWVGLFLADLWLFEDGTRQGAHDWMPKLRPGAALAERRMRILETVLTSVAAPARPDAESVGDLARRLVDSAPPERKQALLLTMQPVHVTHDEYLFIRVLQSFEVTFASMAADMRDAIAAVRDRHTAAAALCLKRCGATLAAARGLFTLLATMRAESFRAFRVFTVGASAIQSGNYKTFEALCSVPPRTRVDSPAFESVPRVRDQIRRGWDDFTTAVEASLALGALDDDGLRSIVAAASDLEDTHQRWKQTHWKMAIRMIGEERGTGYTVGVPYLKAAIDNRLFDRLLATKPGDPHPESAM